ncbi:MAG: 2-oxoacid:ferredoxin oxidoreductase subunit beta [Bacteroidota bacterium]
MIETKSYTAKDFKSDQEIRWCAGCGDIAIINAVQKAMAEMDHRMEDYAVISGIGCSSRFPYYMNTYGFHSIHGRAGAIASGVKTANPKLSVWQITGDGDALAIGGNHFIHEIRRNVDLNIVLFNNEIYGLTKGQFSPTSQFGQVTKTSPYGTVEHPFHPGELTIGAQGKYFARGIDNNVKLNIEIFKDAENHNGTSVIEVLQNCVIFNNGAHSALTDREHKEDRTIILRHGEPMIFGKEKNKGLVLDGLKLKVVTIGENGVTQDDILVHDAHEKDPTLHLALINMRFPDFPVAFGVIRAVEAHTYDERVETQVKEVQAKAKIKNMDDLLNSGSTWKVE